MAGQVNTDSVVCKTERNNYNIVGRFSKFGAKLSFNEDGTPTIIDGSYVFMKDNGSSLSLNSNLIDIKIDNQVVRVVADDNSVEEITLDCTNPVLMLDEIGLPGSSVDLQHDVNEIETATANMSGLEGDESQACEVWGDDATRLLISLYGDLMAQVKTRKIRTFKIMWEKVSELMLEHGYKFTGCQASNRFKTLKRAYAKRKFDLKYKRIQKGRIRPFLRRCPYEKELDALFTKQAEIFPESALSTDEEIISRAQLMASAGLDASSYFDEDDTMQQFGDSSSVSYMTPLVEIVDHMDYGEPLSGGHNMQTGRAESPRRRPKANALEELRSLRASTLERLTVMDVKQDSFHEEVLEELKHKNDMLEKLLELVTKETLG